MIYPTINEYVEAILNASDNFDKLSSLKPVKGNDGKPIMSTGNFSVVFKMVDSDSGKLFAVKCFTKEQENRKESYREIAEEFEFIHSSFVSSINYYDKELYVYSDRYNEYEFPVVVMDWIEGKTLEDALKEDLSADSVYSLALQFSELSTWLISQPFSHGDIKPDNIIVKDDGTLVLIDYDGMYVPSMKGQEAREVGTPDYRHPRRAYLKYDEHIDDFSIIILTISLLLIYKDASLYNEHRAIEGLIFSENDLLNINACSLYNILKNKYNDSIINPLFEVFESCLKDGYINKKTFFYLKLPEFYDQTIIQGIRASEIISDKLWEISQNNQIRSLNATDNILNISDGKNEINITVDNNKLYLGTDTNGQNVLFSYSYTTLKTILLGLDMWDDQLKLKISSLYNGMVIKIPELIMFSINSLINKKYNVLVNDIDISICGFSLSFVFKKGLYSIKEQQFIHELFSSESFQDNCKLLCINKILLIDGLNGEQEIINTKNL